MWASKLFADSVLCLYDCANLFSSSFKTNMKKCSIKYSQNICFSYLTLAEKKQVKNLGCEFSDLVISQSLSSRNQTYCGRFNMSIYSEFKQLCGWKIHCFAFHVHCLFGDDATYTKFGVDDLKHLGKKVIKHEHSAKHMKNIIDLAVRKDNIVHQLIDSYKKQTNKLIEKVRKNQEIL